MAKRIAYGLSRTILYIGASESKATQSVQWLRGQIEPKVAGDGSRRATEYALTFGLRPGAKWQEHEIQVVQSLPKGDGTTEEKTSWVMGVGITGSIRGINFDDYRPDLIILDDVIDDENAATQVQRTKIKDLIMGAVLNSLAPRTEEPNAKLVMLQTPLDGDDAVAQVENDPEWKTESYGCWTEATADLPVHLQESSWPDRYPSLELRAQKLNAVAQNRYSIFAREMEVRLAQAETRSFIGTWLRKYDEPPAIGTCVISIDPVPPPSEAQMKKGLKGKDFEAISVVSRSKQNYYLLDYALSRGHDPSWTSAKLFEFMLRYRPICCVLSLVSAERYLKWFIEKEMERKRIFIALKEAPIGKQSKFNRILASLNGVANQGKLWCAKSHTEFILQFESYGVGYKGLDDLLESVANGVAELTNPYLELTAEELSAVDEEYGDELKFIRACP